MVAGGFGEVVFVSGGVVGDMLVYGWKSGCLREKGEGRDGGEGWVWGLVDGVGELVNGYSMQIVGQPKDVGK